MSVVASLVGVVLEGKLQTVAAVVLLVGVCVCSVHALRPLPMKMLLQACSAS